MTQRDDSDSGASTVTGHAAPPTDADRARTVASELDSIFAEVGDLPPARVEAAREESLILHAAPRLPRRARRSLTGTLGALATVLLVGGAVGVLAQRQQWLQPQAERPARAMSVAVLPDPPRAAPAPTPALAAQPAPAQAPASPQPVAINSTAGPPASSAPDRPVPQRLAALQASEPRRAATVDRCGSMPPMAQTLCRNPGLGEADGRLRDAYDLALDAGVPLQVLGRYRAEWDSQRRRAAQDPGAVAESYDAMAAELKDYAATAAGRG